jgi:hypothetical protein
MGLCQLEAFGAVAAELLPAGRMKRAWPNSAFASCLFSASDMVSGWQHQWRALPPSGA